MTARWSVALAVLLVLVSAGCTFDLYPSPSDVDSDLVFVQGVVWRSSYACGHGEGRVLAGSELVFTDPSGKIVGTPAMSGSCGPAWQAVDSLIPVRTGFLVTAAFGVQLPRAAFYRVSFSPGPNFGERAAPSGTQSVSPQALDAASSRMNYDTGEDGPTSSSPGRGLELGPRVCVGFPVPGCDP